jgi:hypothetical protein
MSRIQDDGSSGSGDRETVEVDLADLVSIGQVLLPALADDYARLNRMAARVSEQSSLLFDWSPGVVGNGPGAEAYVSGARQIGSQWSALCDMLQNAFGKSATNLQAAGSTVLSIEARYQTTDHVSAGELKKVFDGQVWPQDKGFKDHYPKVHVTETE